MKTLLTLFIALLGFWSAVAWAQAPAVAEPSTPRHADGLFEVPGTPVQGKQVQGKHAHDLRAAPVDVSGARTPGRPLQSAPQKSRIPAHSNARALDDDVLCACVPHGVGARLG